MWSLKIFPALAQPRVWAALGVAGGAALLSGCVVAPLDDGYADYGYSSTTVYTQYGYPPAPRVEYRTVAPSPHHVWEGGDWLWGGSRYDWRPGRWASPGYRPVPPPPRPYMHAPPSRPLFRPDERRRLPHARPEMSRPRPPEGRPDGHRPPRQQMQQPWSPAPQARPDRPRAHEARPDRPRHDGDERRGPPQRRDRDDDRR